MSEKYELAITQTLTQKYNKYDCISQLASYLPIFLQALEKFHVKDVVYSVEITKQGNIHFHGILNFCTREQQIECIEYYNLVYKTSLGFSMIKYITDRQGWLDYMQKDLKNTLNKLNAIYEHKYRQQKKCPLRVVNNQITFENVYNYKEFKKDNIIELLSNLNNINALEKKADEYC